MTFLCFLWYLTVAIFILGAAGYVVAFCILFCYFDDCDPKHLKADLMYAFASWLIVSLVLICWILESADSVTSEYD